jgi:hypothetical protein
VGKDVFASRQTVDLLSACPKQLSLRVVKSDAVFGPRNRGGEGNPKVDCHRSQSRNSVGLDSIVLGNVPTEELCLLTREALQPLSAFVAGHGGFVGGDYFVGGTVLADLAVVDPDYAVAEAADLVELVRDEDDGAAGAGDVAHFAEALFLEVDVADGEDFVDEENFGFEMGGHGEGQADVHAAGVVLDRGVDKFFEFGEGDDFVELAGDVALAHAEDGAGEKGVFAAGQFGVEASADLEEAADAAVDLGVAGGGTGDTGKDFEERGFAGAVAADETEDFAFVNVKRNVFEGPEGFLLGAAESVQRITDELFEGVTEAGVGLEAAAVVFAERGDVDDGGGEGGHGFAPGELKDEKDREKDEDKEKKKEKDNAETPSAQRSAEKNGEKRERQEKERREKERKEKKS